MPISDCCLLFCLHFKTEPQHTFLKKLLFFFTLLICLPKAIYKHIISKTESYILSPTLSILWSLSFKDVSSLISFYLLAGVWPIRALLLLCRFGLVADSSLLTLWSRPCWPSLPCEWMNNCSTNACQLWKSVTVKSTLVNAGRFAV